MPHFIAPTMTRKNVTIIEEQELYNGFLKLKKYLLRHRLFNGDWREPHSRELLLRHRVAAALPYDPKLNQVVLIEQFRIGAYEDETSPWLLELVAGIMNGSESLESLINRETQEEAGLTIQELIPICDYWVSPGGS